MNWEAEVRYNQIRKQDELPNPYRALFFWKLAAFAGWFFVAALGTLLILLDLR